MGYLYILHNEIEHGAKDWFKVGFVRKEAGLERRRRELRSSGIVGDYYLLRAWKIEDSVSIARMENPVHLKLKARRISPDREFFIGPYNELVSAIEDVFKFMGIEAESVDCARKPKRSEPSRVAKSERNGDGISRGAHDSRDCLDFLAEIKSPLEPFHGSWAEKRKGFTLKRDFLAWARIVYWLAPLIAGNSSHIWCQTPCGGKLCVSFVPSIEEAAHLVDFEARISASGQPFAPLPFPGIENIFQASWSSGTGRARCNLDSVIPTAWKLDKATGTGLGRLRTGYCWEIGLKEGFGAPQYGNSYPLPLSVAQAINDPHLKIWIRVFWQALKIVPGDQGAWAYSLPECQLAGAWVAQVIGALAALGYDFPQADIQAVMSMWDRAIPIERMSS